MRKKLLMLTVGLGLSVAAVHTPAYAVTRTIVCDSCISTWVDVSCQCAPNSRHPNAFSNCLGAAWHYDCWNGVVP